MADPILKVSEKIADRIERDMANIKKPLDDWANEVDAWFQKRIDVSRRIGRAYFAANAVVTSPIAAVALVKNMRENPNASTAEILDKAMADTMDITLEVANNIWPGTKPGTKDKAVEVLKLITKAANIDAPLK